VKLRQLRHTSLRVRISAIRIEWSSRGRGAGSNAVPLSVHVGERSCEGIVVVSKLQPSRQARYQSNAPQHSGQQRLSPTSTPGCLITCSSQLGVLRCGNSSSGFGGCRGRLKSSCEFRNSLVFRLIGYHALRHKRRRRSFLKHHRSYGVKIK
jgi:hypothetical protein